MLENRDYMRADYEPAPPPRLSGGGWRYSLTIWLIITNGIVFLGQNLFPALEVFGALRTTDLWHGAVWQLLTYQFLHGSLMHVLVNCFTLYWFGRAIENNFGWRRMLALYLGSGVVGGLVQAMFFTFIVKGAGMVAVVGASAGVFGLVAAFAILFRNQSITMFVIVFPITMKAKYLLLIEVVLSVLGLFGLLAANDNIAHAAHLGGMLVGVAWALSVEGWLPQLPRRKAAPPSRFHSLEMTGTQTKSNASAGARSRTSAEDLPKDQLLAQEVDSILDKISAQGIHSLTEREKRILEAARQKMAKR